MSVAEEGAFWQGEVESQRFDVWGRVAQSGKQVLLQTGSNLRETEGMRYAVPRNVCDEKRMAQKAEL